MDQGSKCIVRRLGKAPSLPPQLGGAQTQCASRASIGQMFGESIADTSVFKHPSIVRMVQVPCIVRDELSLSA